MESDQSLAQYLKRLEKLISILKSVRRLNTLSKEEREVMISVRDNSALARAQVEYSLGDEDDEAARKGLKLAIDQLSAVREGLLMAGMYDLLDAVDIAQYTSMTDLCIDRLQRILNT